MTADSSHSEPSPQRRISKADLEKTGPAHDRLMARVEAMPGDRFDPWPGGAAVTSWWRPGGVR